MHKENPFMRHVGPAPGDAPKYKEPEGANPLVEPDPSTVSRVRHQLAIRARRLAEETKAVDQ